MKLQIVHHGRLHEPEEPLNFWEKEEDRQVKYSDKIYVRFAVQEENTNMNRFHGELVFTMPEDGTEEEVKAATIKHIKEKLS